MRKTHIVSPTKPARDAEKRISVLVPPELKAQLQRLADAQHRTLSGQVVLYLDRAVQQEVQAA